MVKLGNILLAGVGVFYLTLLGMDISNDINEWKREAERKRHSEVMSVFYDALYGCDFDLARILYDTNPIIRKKNINSIFDLEAKRVLQMTYGEERYKDGIHYYNSLKEISPKIAACLDDFVEQKLIPAYQQSRETAK